MSDYFIPALGLVCMALQPIVAPLVTDLLTTLFAFVSQLFGIYQETLSGDDDDAAMRAAMRRLSATAWGTTRRTEAGKVLLGPGLFVCRQRRIVGWISKPQDKYSGLAMTVVCSDAARKALTAPDDDGESETPIGGDTPKLEGKDVTCYSAFHGSMQFTEEAIAAPTLRIAAQERIAAAIISEIDVGVCALVTGPPGSGKSVVASLVAAMLSGAGREPTIIRGYTPLSNSGSIHRIVDRFRPCKQSPLILCLDEFDSMVARVMDDRRAAVPAPEKRAAPEVSDKASLCGYLDRLARRKHFALIATCNSDLAWWTAQGYDFAIRPGRFAIKESLESMSPTEVAEILSSDVGSAVSVGELAEAFKRSHGDMQRVRAALALARPA